MAKADARKREAVLIAKIEIYDSSCRLPRLKAYGGMAFTLVSIVTTPLTILSTILALGSSTLGLNAIFDVEGGKSKINRYRAEVARLENVGDRANEDLKIIIAEARRRGIQ